MTYGLEALKKWVKECDNKGFVIDSQRHNIIKELLNELAKEREGREEAVEEESLRWAKRLEWINNKFPVDCSGLDSGDYLDGVEYTIETAFRELEQQKEAAKALVAVLKEELKDSENDRRIASSNLLHSDDIAILGIADMLNRSARETECVLANLPDYAAKYQAVVKLLEVAKCPACDGGGAIGHETTNYREDDEGNSHPIHDVEWEQCQWCDERSQAVRQLKED